MVRDFSNNTYILKRANDEIKMNEEHFQPIFFANNVDNLRNNPAA